ncbi:hypothetical protein CS0771_11170 [Catellatospora sp. IY07-71]|uniref:hypothetical protein n=1 Tax=Catellatospora sp. IY07-71 TaxID=2728827 RepID=UPI001BB32E31|nr:hypothetical protein [Catellatospora sp. IY07-71]BCJ71573.1 hypothetical protein CS0771_11170 [Catellatospora sp. IY07-71]
MGSMLLEIMRFARGPAAECAQGDIGRHRDSLLPQLSGGNQNAERTSGRAHVATPRRGAGRSDLVAAAKKQARAPHDVGNSTPGGRTWERMSASWDSVSHQAAADSLRPFMIVELARQMGE